MLGGNTRARRELFVHIRKRRCVDDDEEKPRSSACSFARAVCIFTCAFARSSHRAIGANDPDIYARVVRISPYTSARAREGASSFTFSYFFNYRHPRFFLLARLIAMRLVFHDRSNLSAEKGIRARGDTTTERMHARTFRRVLVLSRDGKKFKRPILLLSSDLLSHLPNPGTARRGLDCFSQKRARRYAAENCCPRLHCPTRARYFYIFVFPLSVLCMRVIISPIAVVWPLPRFFSLNERRSAKHPAASLVSSSLAKVPLKDPL